MMATLSLLIATISNILITQSTDTLAHAVDIYSSCDATPNSSIHVNNGLYYIKPLVYVEMDIQ